LSATDAKDGFALFDRLAALVGFTVLSPVMALIAVMVKLDSPGSVLFTQDCVGRGEKLFKMYKFRTMRSNAHQEWHPPQRVNDFSTFVFHSIWPDKRITKLGRILRKSSLDELPQLVNVIKGDMKIVGPRPDEKYLVDQYAPEFHRRHDVRPGITGLAQVNGRSDLTYSQMMAYDLEYVDHHPFRRDLSILARTLRVGARSEGAR
jgi:lipopolysaccharide/colanic/teichoic acid biosynthesis glycosyltransferase